MASRAWGQGRRRADRASARSRLHRRRCRGADRAGHARRPAGAAAQAAQGRGRLPQRAGGAQPGDLVVHAEHGIGRYVGLTSIKVGNAPHDCVALEYAGSSKLYVPVENIDVLTRYGSESDGVPLDRLGGEAWQRRKSRMKERIREIAGELIKTAAIRATRPGAMVEADSSYPAFVDRFPYRRDRRPGPRDRRGDRRSGGGAADGPAGVRRRRLRQDRSGDARGVRHGDVGDAGRAGRADDLARPPALHQFRRAVSRLSAQHRPPVAAGPGGRSQGDSRGPGARHRSTSSSAPTRSSESRSSSRNWASSLSTRSSISE